VQNSATELYIDYQWDWERRLRGRERLFSRRAQMGRQRLLRRRFLLARRPELLCNHRNSLSPRTCPRPRHGPPLALLLLRRYRTTGGKRAEEQGHHLTRRLMIISQKASKRARSKIMYRHGGAYRFLRRPRPGRRKNRRKQNRGSTMTRFRRCLGVLIFISMIHTKMNCLEPVHRKPLTDTRAL
jgi:hypothetical protein